jgi:hypothetical protein
MITLLPGLPANVIGIEAAGKVERDDYEQTIVPQIDEKQRQFEKVRLLYVLGEAFEGYTAGAVWEDATLAFKHPGSWERIAVVTDDETLRKAIGLVAWMVPGEVKLFPVPELPAAKEWVAA